MPALPLASPPVRFGYHSRQLGSAPVASGESARGSRTSVEDVGRLANIEGAGKNSHGLSPEPHNRPRVRYSGGAGNEALLVSLPPPVIQRPRPLRAGRAIEQRADRGKWEKCDGGHILRTAVAAKM